LVDSGATENFIDRSAADSLELKTFGPGSSILLASSKFSTPTYGTTVANISVLGREYEKLEFGVVGLCADVILGHEFLYKRSEVTFYLGGSGLGFPCRFIPIIQRDNLLSPLLN